MTIYLNNAVCRISIGIMDNQDVIPTLRGLMRLKPLNAFRVTRLMYSKGVTNYDPYRYFVSKKGEFGTGLLPRVLKTLDSLGVTYNIVDERVVTVNRVRTVKKLDGKTLAAHQLETLEKTFNQVVDGVSYIRGIWDLAPNSGKTLTSAALIASLDNPVVLILVDSRTIFSQHAKDYGRIFGDYFGVFTKKNSHYKNKRVVLAMVQTLSATVNKDVNVKAWLKRVNVLIVDEVHNFAASVGRASIIRYVDAYIKIGMSGTPFNQPEKTQRATLMALFGDTIHKVSKKYLMDIGFSLEPQILIHRNPTVLFQPSRDYKDELTMLVHNSLKFNTLVAELALDYMIKGHRVLVVFDIIDHGRNICDALSQYYDDYSYADGKIPTKDRIKAISDFTDGVTNILVASTIVQEGWSVPDISVIIYTIGGKSDIRLSQFMARAERIDGVSTEYIWVDFWHGGYYSQKHFRERLSAYRKEQFTNPIKFKYLCDNKGKPILQNKKTNL